MSVDLCQVFQTIIECIDPDIRFLMRLRGVCKDIRNVVHNIYPSISKSALFRRYSRLLIATMFHDYEHIYSMQINMHDKITTTLDGDYVYVYKGGKDIIFYRRNFITYNIDKIIYNGNGLGNKFNVHKYIFDGRSNLMECLYYIDDDLYLTTNINALNPPTISTRVSTKDEFNKIYCGYPVKVPIRSSQAFLIGIKYAYCPISIITLFESWDSLIDVCMSCPARIYAELSFISYEDKIRLIQMGNSKLPRKEIIYYAEVMLSKVRGNLRHIMDIYEMMNNAYDKDTAYQMDYLYRKIIRRAWYS